MLGYFRCLMYFLLVLSVTTTVDAGILPVAGQDQAVPSESMLGIPRPEPTIQECEQRRREGRIRRVAFVVGNNKTKNFNLKNAIADAILIQTTLLDLGYEVASVFDADRSTIIGGLDRFKEHVKTLCEHDVAAFYYAGNGFEISGVTYIATPDVEYPTDPKAEFAVLSHWLRLTDVLARFSHHSGVKVIMIDTCRDDPLAKQRTAPPAPPGGFRLPPNTLVSYASEPGHQANDIGPNGVNGPYAYFVSRFLKQSTQPLDAISLFGKVRAAVSESTKGTVLPQWPFVDQTVQQHVYLGSLPELVDAQREETRVLMAKRGDRVALVIGDGKYRHRSLPPLRNATNDARTFSDALRKIGFEVREFHDLGKARIEEELFAFQLRANGADIALIYYAGHGIERNSAPFIIPVGANLLKDTDVDSEGIAVMPMLEHLRGVRKLGMLLLDACRDNPLAELENVAGDPRNQRVTSGLPPFEISVENVIVAYAAQHGTSSYDGEGKNGYFVQALVENLDTPGLEVGMLLRKVRDGVVKRSAIQKTKQQPWTYSTLPGEPIYLMSQ